MCPDSPIGRAHLTPRRLGLYRSGKEEIGNQPHHYRPGCSNCLVHRRPGRPDRCRPHGRLNQPLHRHQLRGSFSLLCHGNKRNCLSLLRLHFYQQPHSLHFLRPPCQQRWISESNECPLLRQRTSSLGAHPRIFKQRGTRLDSCGNSRKRNLDRPKRLRQPRLHQTQHQHPCDIFRIRSCGDNRRGDHQ